MASWIESHTNLERHPKFIQFKASMRWSKNETVGFLHRFWWTVLEYAPTGYVSAFSREVVAELLGMTVEQLNAAYVLMEKYVFLERQGGELRIHGWLTYVDKYLSNTKYRRDPQRYQEVKDLYALPADKNEGDMSTDMARNRGDMSTVPDLPDQPNQPNPKAAVGGESENTPEGKPKAEMIYQAYPRKVGKAAALKAINLARKRLIARGEPKPLEYLMIRVNAYALARQGQDSQYTPHPNTWFNQDRYDDDPVEWKAKNTSREPESDGFARAIVTPELAASLVLDEESVTP